MRLTLQGRTDLALRSLRWLEGRTDTVRAAEMAAALHSTPTYLPQVLRPLVRAGWLDSEPGPTGGYRLAGDLSTRSILELIEVVEGPIATEECVLRGGPCPGHERCALHEPWQEAREALVARLASLPISERLQDE